MLAKCYSGAINGVDARMVEIEVYSQIGTSQFAIVGLPDTAVKEAKDRIPKALKSQGLALKKEYDVTVNLAPADVRKEGSIYDLPIAVGLLGASGQIRNRHLDEYGLIGELALSGEVREVICAPADGLVFSQRSYSAVYPGTLIARLFRRK